MSVGRKEKEKVVLGDNRSNHTDDSKAAPDFEVLLTDKFPPDLPILQKAVSDEEVRRRVEDEGTQANDESEVIPVGALLSIVGCESQGGLFCSVLFCRSTCQTTSFWQSV